MLPDGTLVPKYKNSNGNKQALPPAETTTKTVGIKVENSDDDRPSSSENKWPQESRNASSVRSTTAAELLEEIQRVREKQLVHDDKPHRLHGGSTKASDSYEGSLKYRSTQQSTPDTSNQSMDGSHELVKGEDSLSNRVSGGHELFSGLHFMRSQSASRKKRRKSVTDLVLTLSSLYHLLGQKSSKDQPKRTDTNEQCNDDKTEDSSEDENDFSDSKELALMERDEPAKKRIRLSKSQKQNLWTVDAHLHHLSVWLEYLTTYK